MTCEKPGIEQRRVDADCGRAMTPGEMHHQADRRRVAEGSDDAQRGEAGAEDKLRERERTAKNPGGLMSNALT